MMRSARGVVGAVALAVGAGIAGIAWGEDAVPAWAYVKAPREQPAPQRVAEGPGDAAPPRTDTIGEHHSASGIVLSEKGDVLTAAHVVDGCSVITVSTEDEHKGETVTQAKLVRALPDEDLALVRLVQPWRGGVARLRKGPPRLGEEVVVAGYALPGVLGSALHITTGIVSTMRGPDDDARLMQLSAPVQLGNSGGPVLDRSGNVVGVVMGKLDSLALAKLTGALAADVSFAVHGKIAQAFLTEESVPFASGPLDNERSSADVAEMAQGFTVKVDCWAQQVASGE